MAQLEAMLQGATGVYAFLAAAILAVLFLVLFITKKGGGGGADTAAELKQAQNQIKLLKGDAMQANKELETLRAAAGGQVPREIQDLKDRLQTSETKLGEVQKERDSLAKELDDLHGSENLDKTVIAPSTEAIHARVAELEAQVEAAKQDANAVAERLSAEKAAAISALEKRHQAAMDALAQNAGGGAAAISAAMSAAAAAVPEAATANADALPYFEVVEGNGQGSKTYLPFSSGSIGRSEDCTYTLDEDRASRHHADLVYENGRFAIRDNNSTNGTFLNDQPVSRQDLAFGDVVTIGDSKLKFSCKAADVADSNPQAAIEALESMIRSAPDFAPAQEGLAQLRG